VDKGKAKNYSNRSNNSGDIVNNNTRDNDSSSSDKGNKVCGYIGRQGLPTSISG
jgi:hypothetical protein